MGWTVYVKLTRARGLLARTERDALVALVGDDARAPWAHEPFDLRLPPLRRRADALAYGLIKLARDPEHPDVDRLMELLTALRGAIEGALCEVGDDDGLVVWTGSGYALGVGAQPEVIAPDTSGWQSARALAAAPRRRAPAPAATRTPLEAAIAVLAAVPAKGFATDLAEKRAAAAVEQVAGDPALREPVLAAWRRTPAPRGAMVAMRWLVTPFLTAPWFRDELLASIARAGQPGEGHRAYVAADLLLTTRPSDPAGLRAVLAVMRRYRRDPGSFAVEPPADPPDDNDRTEPVVRQLMWLPHLWRGTLSPLERAAAAAGCALALASPGSTEFVPRAVMAFGGVASLPLVARIPADHPHALGVAHQATAVARHDPAGFEPAAALCLRHAFHPFVQVRIEAARALRNLCGMAAQPLLDRAVAAATEEGLDNRVFSFGDLDTSTDRLDAALAEALGREVPLADPVDDLVARDRWHRGQGVTRYVRRHARHGGPLLPLLLFEEVNELLPAHARAPSVSWRDCAALPPPLQRRAAAAERAAFIRGQATAADHAALPPRLREVESLGAAAVAARVAAPMPAVIELSAAERADLEAAERAWLGEG